jgi:hypothetical protein
MICKLGAVGWHYAEPRVSETVETCSNVTASKKAVPPKLKTKNEGLLLIIKMS